MSQPPQDRPDYPWGPSEGEHPARPARRAASEPAPEPTERVQLSQGGAAPSVSTPYTGTPYTGTSQTGGQTGPGAAAGSGYAGTPYTGSSPARLGDDASGPARAGEGAGAPTSTIVLLVVSGVAVLTGALTLAGLPSLVLAIVALTRAGTDPAGARRLTRIGWWVFAGLVVLGAVLLGIGIALLFALGGAAGSGYDDVGSTSATFASLGAGLSAVLGAAW